MKTISVMHPRPNDVLFDIVDKLFVFHILIIVTAAVALAGCSKSDDGIKETKETMNWEQYIKNVNEHIIGTWQHDGVYYGSEGYHLVLDDDPEQHQRRQEPGDLHLRRQCRREDRRQ